MFNQFLQKRGGPSFRLSGILLLILTLQLCCVLATADAEETIPVTPDEPGSTCKGLKPYNNIDELLYQFYINLDSDCLFEMSTAELEKVWNIKILDDERVKPKNFYPLSETEFFNKPYKIEKDAFYMERTIADPNPTSSMWWAPINKFRLKPTNEYFEKHGPLFPDGDWPKLLPESNKRTNSLYKYYYASSDGGRAILILKNDGRVIKTTKNGDIELRRMLKLPITIRESKNEANAAEATKPGDAPCRGLKRYENLDELLYQFYINLDSDCLFEMSVEELEKIWDIKILNRHNTDYWSFRWISSFAGKPYKFERDAFFVEVIPYIGSKKKMFSINITREYGEKYHSLLPLGHFPKLLPEPVELPTSGGHGGLFSYYWFNSDKKRNISINWSYGLTKINIQP